MNINEDVIINIKVDPEEDVVSEEHIKIAEEILAGKDTIVLPLVVIEEKEDEPIEKLEVKKIDIRALIGEMTIPQKIKAAMFGSAVARSLLINDKNRIIQEAVLKNPKMQLREVEAFAKNKSTPSAVLKMISASKDFSKYMSIKQNLVFNPKTPQEISMKWVRFLHMTDLKSLAKSKNIPGPLASVCMKLVKDHEKKVKGG